MPNNQVDFSKLEDVKEIGVQPEGWIEPLNVEYGLGFKGMTPSCFWRVKGTKHTFIIPITRLHFLSSGDYEKHFRETLEGFRKEYLEWKDIGFQYEWMRDYRDQYSKFIIS
jgi:hypothetical protein